MPCPDPDWLDIQYNNRARIPDHAAIFGRWGLASALARDKLAGHLDVAYGPTPEEALDVFTVTREAAPVLVFIHGGYWRSLDKRDHTFIAPAFTHAGAMVVIPNYALCPAVTIDEISLQLVRALEWTYRNVARYGGDPSRIVVAGHSAGGHLAAMMLSCRWPQVAGDLPPALVTGAVSISGLFDLEPLRHTPFLQSDLQLTEASARRLSPARFEAPLGKLHALVGGDESEEFLRQNRSIRDAWGVRAVPVCESVANTHHLNVLHELADPQTRVHQLTLDLLGLEPLEPGQAAPPDSV